MFAINPVFDTKLCRESAERIARGARIVRRDANPNRCHAITFEHLAKIGPISSVHLQDLISCFAMMIGGSPLFGMANAGDARGHVQDAVGMNRFTSCTVLGLAESGIVPSFAMKTACESFGIDSAWFCSSRVDTGGRKFSEPHSHAPEHFLPRRLLNQMGEELWIVEDEVTTGRTIKNLLNCIYDLSKIRKCRVFTLLDARNVAEMERFKDTCCRRGWDVTFQSVLQPTGCSFFSSEQDSFSNRFGSTARHFVVGEAIAAALPSLLSGDIQYLQHITLSPWVIDGQQIVSRKSWEDAYYVYNAPEYEPQRLWSDYV